MPVRRPPVLPPQNQGCPQRGRIAVRMNRRLCGSTLGCLAALIPAAAISAPPAGDTPEPAAKSLDPARQRELDATNNVEELVRLGKTWLITGDAPAAAAVVEKLCTLKPEMLTDGRRLSPRTWNDFCFLERARIREAKIARDDIPARLELVRWLYDGGLTGPARQRLTALLAIAKDHPEARKLAEEWHLFGGGPVQFDLTPGLARSLVTAELRDEGHEMVPNRGRTWLIVPFRYDAGQDRLIFNRSDLKVTGEDGRSCSVRGLMLMGAASISGFGGVAVRPGSGADIPALQGDSEPLLERMQIDRNKETGALEVTCFNTAAPIVRRKPGESAPPTGGPLRPPPRAAGGAAQTDKKFTREASGYAAFVVEVPEGFVVLDCSLGDYGSLRLERAFLDQLALPTDDLEPARLKALVDDLTARLAGRDGTLAGAAVRKLAGMRTPSVPGAAGPGLDPATSARIDDALLNAVGHDHQAVRRAAIFALLGSPEMLTPGLLDRIARLPDPSRQMLLLDEVEEQLSGGTPSGGGPAPAIFNPVLGGSERDAIVAQAVQGLPRSSAAQPLFDLLGACARSPHAQVRDRVLNILFSDGSQQAVMLLAALPPGELRKVQDRLGTVDDPALQSAMLRVLISSLNPAQARALLDANTTVRIRITDPQDPLIAGLGTISDYAELERRLELLSRADLSAFEGTATMETPLGQLGAAVNQMPESTHAALLRFCMAHMNRPYAAPARRPPQFAPEARTPEYLTYEVLLSALAFGEQNCPPAVWQPALTAVLNNGRIDKLVTGTDQARGTLREKDMVDYLTRGKRWDGRDSTPAFLAAMTKDPEPSLLVPLLDGILQLGDTVPPRDRWRYHLALKHQLDEVNLCALTGNSDQALARVAGEVLIRLPGLSTEQKRRMSETSGDGRLTILREIQAERYVKGAGPFGCMLYVDLSAPGYYRVPVIAPQALLQRIGERDMRLRLANKDVTATRARELAADVTVDSPPPVFVNMGVILQMVLSDPKVAATLPIPVKPPSPGGQEVVADLLLSQLGTWSGGADFPVSPGAAPAGPAEVTRALIFLEPPGP